MASPPPPLTSFESAPDVLSLSVLSTRPAATSASPSVMRREADTLSCRNLQASQCDMLESSSIATPGASSSLPFFPDHTELSLVSYLQQHPHPAFILPSPRVRIPTLSSS